jgi:hypothetical protein
LTRPTPGPRSATACRNAPASAAAAPRDPMTYLSNGWSLSGTGPDGTPVALGATTAEVTRRQADGTWRSVIDNAWATRRSPASHRWATDRSTEVLMGRVPAIVLAHPTTTPTAGSVAVYGPLAAQYMRRQRLDACSGVLNAQPRSPLPASRRRYVVLRITPRLCFATPCLAALGCKHVS